LLREFQNAEINVNSCVNIFCLFPEEYTAELMYVET